MSPLVRRWAGVRSREEWTREEMRAANTARVRHRLYGGPKPARWQEDAYRAYIAWRKREQRARRRATT